MKKLLYWIIPFALIGIGYFLISHYSDNRNTTLPPLHTVVVEKGDVSQRVTAFGSLQPVQKVTVGSQVSGIIEALYVDFNSIVKKGDIIARIDPSTFEAQVNSAKAELEAAKASLHLAQIQWKRIQDLRERQFIAPSEADQANATLRQAESNVNVREQALLRAQRELDRCTITSPTDGMVISRNIDVGQTVAASLSAPELFQIATDLSVMHIHAHVSEADIGMVKEDQKVEFRVDAYRGTTFRGVITQVRNAPLVVDNVVHYETIIRVENNELLLKPGMTSEVSIITDEVSDVVRVRNTALRARLPDEIRPADAELPEGYSNRVFRIENNQLVSIPVKTGLSDGLFTEIKSGVTTGDTLAVGLTLRNNTDSGRRSIIGGQQAQF